MLRRSPESGEPTSRTRPHDVDVSTTPAPTTSGLPRAVLVLVGLAAAAIVVAGMRGIADLLAPAFLALILTVLAHPLRKWLDKKLPAWVASTVCIAVVYVGVVLFALAVLVRVVAGEDSSAITAVLYGVGLVLTVPLVALVAGTGVLAPEIDDGSVVYLLAKPVRRSTIVYSKLAVAVRWSRPSPRCRRCLPAWC